MKILVVNNVVPFLKGGAEKLADNLVRQLKQHGHEADLLRIPFRWDPPERLYDEMLACRMLRLYNVDRVIGLKFPAYLIPHADKTMWLVHQFRQAYDLAGTDMSHLPGDERGQELRQAITAADNECFRQVNQIFSISRVVQRRLQQHNGFHAEVLHPPLDDADLFRPESVGDYLFVGGRINSAKRQQMLVEAMRHVTADVRLLIAGPADTAADGARLRDLIDGYRLQDRVQLELGFHPRERIAAWVNRSLACACVPYDEDYGYVTLEAFYAGKPVLTTEDSGGVLDFVTHNVTGAICAPDPRALALGIDQLAEDRSRTRQMGAAAREHIMARNINWPETVKKLAA